MRGPQIYDRVINWPGQYELTLMFCVAAFLIVLATLLLSLGRLRRIARGLGILGMLIVMVTLFVIHEQVDREKTGQYITITRPRFPESTRFQIRVALLGLPAAAALVMATVMASTRRRQRSTVPAHLKLGRKLMTEGNLDASLAEYNRALSISPYLGEAYFQRGRVLELKGQPDKAIADYDRALKSDPQHALAYLHRCKLRANKGELDGALADLDQAMIMRPNDVECYLQRGICLAKKGIVGDAILDFQRVLKLTNHSDFAEPARHYLDQLGSNHPTQAISPPSSNGSSGEEASNHEAVRRDYEI